MGKITIRISGDRADIDAITAYLLDLQVVKKIPKLVYKSIYHPNRKDAGFHRYLDLLVETDPEYKVTLINPELPPENSDR